MAKNETLNYVVYNQSGRPVLRATLPCRYDWETERELLRQGYTIRIDGRKLTKKEVGA